MNLLLITKVVLSNYHQIKMKVIKKNLMMRIMNAVEILVEELILGSK
jgi:hypothetical protein